MQEGERGNIIHYAFKHSTCDSYAVYPGAGFSGLILKSDCEMMFSATNLQRHKGLYRCMLVAWHSNKDT